MELNQLKEKFRLEHYLGLANALNGVTQLPKNVMGPDNLDRKA